MSIASDREAEVLILGSRWFCLVDVNLRHGRVVERPQQDKEDDIDVACPEERERTDDSDGSDERNEDSQHGSCGEVIEQHADERGRDNATDLSNVSKTAHMIRKIANSRACSNKSDLQAKQRRKTH